MRSSTGSKPTARDLLGVPPQAFLPNGVGARLVSLNERGCPIKQMLPGMAAPRTLKHPAPTAPHQEQLWPIYRLNFSAKSPISRLSSLPIRFRPHITSPELGFFTLLFYTLKEHLNQATAAVIQIEVLGSMKRLILLASIVQTFSQSRYFPC
ncbi:hypothetical protein R1flu_016321 [Riccia fluitans]|uniref:Uncharacterized protein n=1 Tax=Riccia fluitans TaxID=41844 RepID=A0ABD1YLW5_9MARC